MYYDNDTDTGRIRIIILANVLAMLLYMYLLASSPGHSHVMYLTTYSVHIKLYQYAHNLDPSKLILVYTVIIALPAALQVKATSSE